MLTRAVIFDWAGTIVDFGSRAPVVAFQKLFRDFGVNITVHEARKPMGAHKREHIRQILAMNSVVERFHQAHDRYPTSRDVELMCKAFTPFQLEAIRDCQWIPGADHAIRDLKSLGIKVGSCTGYSADMMEPLLRLARESNCMPDCVVTASDVEKGRPSPDMVFEVCKRLGVLPDKHVVKVGDTLLDIKEGLNAGVTSIGVTDTGNEMGYSLSEWSQVKDSCIIQNRREKIKEQFIEAGANDTIRSVASIVDALRRVVV